MKKFIFTILLFSLSSNIFIQSVSQKSIKNWHQRTKDIWQKHSGKIIAAAGILGLLVAGGAGWRYYDYREYQRIGYDLSCGEARRGFFGLIITLNTDIRRLKPSDSNVSYSVSKTISHLNARVDVKVDDNKATASYISTEPLYSQAQEIFLHDTYKNCEGYSQDISTIAELKSEFNIDEIVLTIQYPDTYDSSKTITKEIII